MTCTPPWCLEAGLAGFELEHQLLMSLFGHSEMGGTMTVLSTAQYMLFRRMLPGATGVPPPKTQERKKRMIPILERGTPMLNPLALVSAKSIQPLLELTC